MRQTLEDIRAKFVNGLYKNEEHVRLSLVARILNDLGWDLWNPAEVNTEFTSIPTEDNSRVDIALFLTPYSPPSVYIEVKAAGKLEGNIGQYEIQLRDYNRNNTAVFTVMTDGRKWRFYYSQTGGEFSKKCFKTLDLIRDDLEELELAFQSFLAKSEVSNGSAKQNAENYLQLSQKQRAMEDVSPHARKAILEPPYPSLPQAMVELVAKVGITITIEEASQFIREFDLRKPISDQVSRKTSVSTNRSTFANSSDIPIRLTEVLEVCCEVFQHKKRLQRRGKDCRKAEESRFSAHCL